MDLPKTQYARSGDVHIGVRVAALAGPGEVLVTRTVRDLVAGSGIEFEDRGTHSLKGLPEDWQRANRAFLSSQPTLEGPLTCGFP
ncbi:MAG: hypothetical protein ACRDIX_00010 [Actinomycetota bacterium]